MPTSLKLRISINGTYDDAQPFDLRDILETLDMRHLATFTTHDSSSRANLEHRKHRIGIIQLN